MTDRPRATQESTAVATRPQGALVDVLADWPADRFNQLVPTAYVQQVNPFLVPVVAAVQLDGRDTYHTPDMPNGQDALGKTGLQKLANIAGVSVVDQWRSDDGSNPDVVEYSTKVAMSLPTGQVITAVGSKVEDARRQRFASDAHQARWRKDQPSMAATKSHLRALRALLTLQSTYPVAELRKPWAVVHFVPNMEDPDVRAAMLAGMAGQTARLYGGGERDAGRPKVIEAPAAPDDDAPALGSGTVTTPDGTVIDGATGQPAGDDSPLFDNVRVPLADRLATRAKSLSGADEPATDDQKARLQTALAPLGKDAAIRVVTGVFGIAEIRSISRAEAESVLIASSEEGFEDEWRELAVRLAQ
jgi:hypothetical protein